MTKHEADQAPVPIAVLAVALAGALSALAGGYWDDAWHTEQGRDDFLIAPHVAIYAGVAAAGAALMLSALLTVRRDGPASVWRHRPLALALVGVTVTLASGPVDNAWHVAFGRDAVIWSPPHMLGIAGTLALGAAILAEIAGRFAGWPAAVAGGLVLASAAFTTVEYDTDVPQFDEAFYLPALGLAAALAFAIVREACGGGWASTRAAAVHAALVALVGAFLAAAGFPPPALPLLIVPAAMADVALGRRWHPALAAAAYTVALHAAYVPVRNLLGDGVRFDAGDVVAGAALTWVATSVVFAIADGRPFIPAGALRRGAARAGAGMLVLLAAPAVALAHDPGQGEDAGTVAMRVTAAGDRATLAARLPGATCAATRPRAVAARRGGETVRGALVKRGCLLTGTVRLGERGRWFVYAEMRRGGRDVESWLPISSGSGTRSVSDAARYAYYPPGRSDGAVKAIAGVALYGAMLAVLYATFALVRSGRRRAGGTAGPIPSRTGGTRPAEGRGGGR